MISSAPFLSAGLITRVSLSNLYHKRCLLEIGFEGTVETLFPDVSAVLESVHSRSCLNLMLC